MKKLIIVILIAMLFCSCITLNSTRGINIPYNDTVGQKAKWSAPCYYIGDSLIVK